MNPAPSPPGRPSLFAVASLGFGVAAWAAAAGSYTTETDTWMRGLTWAGAGLGLAGMALGSVPLARNAARPFLAWSGVVVSLLGIGAAAGLASRHMNLLAQAQVDEQAAEAGAAHAIALRAEQAEMAKIAPWLGAPAPDIAATTPDGKTVHLSDFKGQRVVVVFWATWCGPCVQEIPNWIRLRAENPGGGLVILALSSEDAATLQPYAVRNKINYTIATQTMVPAPYRDIDGIPATFFVDRHGILEDAAFGYHDFDEVKKQALAPDYVGPPKTPPAPAAASGNSTAAADRKP